jgi:hypothetical protein
MLEQCMPDAMTFSIKIIILCNMTSAPNATWLWLCHCFLLLLLLLSTSALISSGDSPSYSSTFVHFLSFMRCLAFSNYFVDSCGKVYTMCKCTLSLHILLRTISTKCLYRVTSHSVLQCWPLQATVNRCIRKVTHAVFMHLVSTSSVKPSNKSSDCNNYLDTCEEPLISTKCYEQHPADWKTKVNRTPKMYEGGGKLTGTSRLLAQYRYTFVPIKSTIAAPNAIQYTLSKDVNGVPPLSICLLSHGNIPAVTEAAACRCNQCLLRRASPRDSTTVRLC